MVICNGEDARCSWARVTTNEEWPVNAVLADNGAQSIQWVSGSWVKWVTTNM